MTSTWPLLLTCVACGVAGQLCLKIGASRLIGLSVDLAGVTELMRRVLMTPLLLIGLAMYGIGAVLWLLALSRAPLSYVYSFTALTFVLVMISSWLLLGEPIPLLRVVGILLILGGFLLAATAR